eukprot:scaffold81469_cov60-Phaeocystis_antarctica.AAC.3
MLHSAIEAHRSWHACTVMTLYRFVPEVCSSARAAQLLVPWFHSPWTPRPPTYGWQLTFPCRFHSERTIGVWSAANR